VSYLVLHLEPGEKRPSDWRIDPTKAFYSGVALGLVPFVLLAGVLLLVLVLA